MGQNLGVNSLRLLPSKPPPKCPTLKRPLPDRSKDSQSRFGFKARKRVRLEKRFDDSGVVNSNIYHSTKFEDSFHDYLPSKYCPGTISADIIKKNRTDTGSQFCSSTEDKNVQTELATCDVGVQVDLPPLRAENLEGNDEKERML